MAYLISEEAQDLLQDVKNFCEKEVVEQCKHMMYPVNGRKRFTIKQSSRAISTGSSGGIWRPGVIEGWMWQHSSSRWQLRMLDCNYHFRQRTWHETGADRRK